METDYGGEGEGGGGCSLIISVPVTFNMFLPKFTRKVSKMD